MLKDLLSTLFRKQPIEVPAKDPVALDIQTAIEEHKNSTLRLEKAIHDFLAENERLRNQRKR